MFNFWWFAEQSEQKMLTKMQKNERGPLSHQKIKCSFLYYVQLLMIVRVIWAKNVDRNAKKQKRPPKSSKNQMFIFVLCSTSMIVMISQAIQAKNVDQTIRAKNMKNENNKKGPLSHWKIKCLLLDYMLIFWCWSKNGP